MKHIILKPVLTHCLITHAAEGRHIHCTSKTKSVHQRSPILNLEENFCPKENPSVTKNKVLKTLQPSTDKLTFCLAYINKL